MGVLVYFLLWHNEESTIIPIGLGPLWVMQDFYHQPSEPPRKPTARLLAFGQRHRRPRPGTEGRDTPGGAELAPPPGHPVFRVLSGSGAS